jgi:hypothetical protein
MQVNILDFTVSSFLEIWLWRAAHDALAEGTEIDLGAFSGEEGVGRSIRPSGKPSDPASGY